MFVSAFLSFWHFSSRNSVSDMFHHAYDSYLKHAYPYDELRPLSCSGVDTWGSYSLTLIDALDTLAILGKMEIGYFCGVTLFQRKTNRLLFFCFFFRQPYWVSARLSPAISEDWLQQGHQCERVWDQYPDRGRPSLRPPHGPSHRSPLGKGLALHGASPQVGGGRHQETLASLWHADRNALRNGKLSIPCSSASAEKLKSLIMIIFIALFLDGQNQNIFRLISGTASP